jgi:hypothetical protein
MILNIVKCEQCENQFPMHPHQHMSEWDIPSGWITMFIGSMCNSTGYHFCSMQCLSEWLEDKKARGIHERTATSATSH